MQQTQEYVNIMEAARRCGTSDKTIRRAVAAHKLPVHRPKSNVALIAVSDLQEWHELTADAQERRITALEQQMDEYHTEQLGLMKRTITFHDNFTILQETEKYNTVQQLHKMMEAMKLQDEHIAVLEQQVQALTEQLGQLSGQQAPSPSVPTQLQALPDTIRLNQFADLHGMSRNEAGRLWKVGFIAGEREQGRRRGSVIIDATGMHDFWVQFHDNPEFRKCETCPH